VARARRWPRRWIEAASRCRHAVPLGGWVGVVTAANRAASAPTTRWGAADTVLVRRRLAARLRRARTVAGYTQQQATDHLGFSAWKLSYLEQGRCGASRADLQALGWLYGLPSGERDRWCAMATASVKHPFSAARGVVPDTTLDFLALGSVAETVCHYTARQVPELLRIPDYNRVVIRQFAPAAATHRWYLRRAELTGLLWAAHANSPDRRLCLLLDEAVIDALAAGTRVSRRQLAYIEQYVDDPRDPHTSVQIVPRGAAATIGHHRSFTVVEFRVPDEAAAFVHTGLDTVTEVRGEAGSFQAAFAALAATTTDPRHTAVPCGAGPEAQR